MDLFFKSPFFYFIIKFKTIPKTALNPIILKRETFFPYRISPNIKVTAAGKTIFFNEYAPIKTDWSKRFMAVIKIRETTPAFIPFKILSKDINFLFFKNRKYPRIIIKIN